MSDSLVDQAAPSRANPPSLRDLVAQAGRVSRAELVALVRADQRRRWPRGQRLPAEAYLEQFPTLKADEEAAVDLIYSEALVREELGEAVRPEEYAGRFPQYAAALHRQFALHQLLQGDSLPKTGTPETPPLSSPEVEPPHDAAGDQPEDTVKIVDSSPPPAGDGTAWPTVPGYEILGKLGSGGMGVVYKARQLSVNRDVALKMLRDDAFADPEDRARFRKEAEDVARLVHPHIVRVYDSGEHRGRPFFSMEQVDGDSLDRKLAGTPLPPRAAAELVETLARAVAYAHERKLIHRDLKPANVLLAADGTPKVTDFGLAKRLEGEAGSSQSGPIVGTPSYMPPEQAAGRTREVGPAADVYALGAILYECLTGRPPFKAATPLGTVLQVLGEEPVPPRQLQSTMPRDLETICLKCLEKDPTKRYATATALADDLRRFQAGQPVAARPLGRWGRAAKWARRNPAVAGLLAAVAALLVLGTAVATLLAVRADANARLARTQKEAAEASETKAKANERKATQERDRAEQEKRTADAVRSFLQNDLLRQADAKAQADSLRLTGGGAEAVENPTIKELLDRAAQGLTAEKIEAKFPQQPLVQAEILHTVGDAYYSVGAYAKAIAHHQRAAALRQIHLGPDHPDTLTTLDDLAGAYLAAGRTAEAIALFGQVRDARIAKLGPDHPDTLTTLNNLAGAYLAAGRTAEAIALFGQVRDAFHTKLGLDHPNTLPALNNLALAYRAAGKTAEAIALLGQVRDAQSTKLGPDHPDTLTTQHNLAMAYRDSGKTAEAIALYEQVRDARIAKLGPDHPDTLATLDNLALAYRSAGNTAQAIALHERVRDARIAKLGPDHPDTLTTLHNLALAYRSAGKTAQAIALLKRVRDARIAKLGPDHPDTLTTLNNLAGAHLAAGRTAEAIALYEQVRDAFLTKLGPDHPDTLTTLHNLAFAYRSAGKTAQAIALWEQMLPKARRVFGASHPHTITFTNNLISALEQTSRFARAGALRGELLAVLRKQLPPDDPQLAGTLAQHGLTMLQAGQPADAEPILRECLAIRTKREPDDWRTFNTESLLGGSLLGQKKYADAEPLLLAGYEGMKEREARIPARGKVPLTEALERLVQLYDAWGKPERAKEWRQKLEQAKTSTKDPKK
jgi:hypothetical protein